jgi:hypothetical protein
MFRLKRVCVSTIVVVSYWIISSRRSGVSPKKAASYRMPNNRKCDKKKTNPEISVPVSAGLRVGALLRVPLIFDEMEEENPVF